MQLKESCFKPLATEISDVRDGQHSGSNRNAAPMPVDSTVRVLVAERNPLVVAALADMLHRDSRFEMVANLENGEAFLDSVAQGLPAFDIAVLAWNLSDMDGGVVLSELNRRELFARVIIFSNEHDVAILKLCMRLGVQGFCYQFEDPSILFETLMAVARGRICVPYFDVSKINETPFWKLTPRERELLALLGDGCTNLQIANLTGISPNTVKYHLKNLYDKLDVRNRTMAAGFLANEKSFGSHRDPQD